MTASMEQCSSGPSPARAQWEQWPCQPVCPTVAVPPRLALQQGPQAQSHPLLLAGAGAHSSLLLPPLP